MATEALAVTDVKLPSNETCSYKISRLEEKVDVLIAVQEL
jgi:hypothetical protein